MLQKCGWRVLKVLHCSWLSNLAFFLFIFFPLSFVVCPVETDKNLPCLQLAFHLFPYFLNTHEQDFRRCKDATEKNPHSLATVHWLSNIVFKIFFIFPACFPFPLSYNKRRERTEPEKNCPKFCCSSFFAVVRSLWHLAGQCCGQQPNWLKRPNKNTSSATSFALPRNTSAAGTVVIKRESKLDVIQTIFAIFAGTCRSWAIYLFCFFKLGYNLQTENFLLSGSYRIFFCSWIQGYWNVFSLFVSIPCIEDSCVLQNNCTSLPAGS